MSTAERFGSKKLGSEFGLLGSCTDDLKLILKNIIVELAKKDIFKNNQLFD